MSTPHHRRSHSGLPPELMDRRFSSARIPDERSQRPVGPNSRPSRAIANASPFVPQRHQSRLRQQRGRRPGTTLRGSAGSIARYAPLVVKSSTTDPSQPVSCDLVCRAPGGEGTSYCHMHATTPFIVQYVLDGRIYPKSSPNRMIPSWRIVLGLKFCRVAMAAIAGCLGSGEVYQPRNVRFSSHKDGSLTAPPAISRCRTLSIEFK
jgi:hypothetical protein